MEDTQKFICNDCNKEFKLKHLYIYHLHRKFKCNEKVSYVCNICNLDCKNKSDY